MREFWSQLPHRPAIVRGVVREERQGEDVDAGEVVGGAARLVSADLKVMVPLAGRHVEVVGVRLLRPWRDRLNK